MLVTEKIGPIWLVSPQGEKIAPLAGTPADGAQPVSYTHLDVYKRQGLLGRYARDRHVVDLCSFVWFFLYPVYYLV